MYDDLGLSNLSPQTSHPKRRIATGQWPNGMFKTQPFERYKDINP